MCKTETPPVPDSHDPDSIDAPELIAVPTPKIAIRTATEPIPLPIDDDIAPSPHALAPGRSSRRNSNSSHRSRSDSRGSSTDGGDSLKTKLRRARKECLKRNKEFFVPIHAQNEILTQDAIAADIQKHRDIGDTEAQKYAEKAHQYAKQLFATLAYTGKAADICALLKEGITDKDLPLVRACEGSFALQRPDGKPIKAFEEWNDEDLETFDRVQYWMTAHVFEDKQHYILDDNIILPFMKFKASETQQAKQGGYSEVFPVRIHPTHHNFWSTSGSEVRKRVNDNLSSSADKCRTMNRLLR